MLDGIAIHFDFFLGDFEIFSALEFSWALQKFHQQIFLQAVDLAKPRMHHDEEVSPQHLPRGYCHARSGAAQEIRGPPGACGELPHAGGRGGIGTEGARFPNFVEDFR